MNEFSGFEIFGEVLTFIVTGLLIRDLWTLSHCGKFIMKVEERSLASIFWVVALILWCFLLWNNIRYPIYFQRGTTTNIVMNVFCIELSISNLLKTLIGAQIRENGIYKSGHFYRWNKIQSYTWRLSNAVKFEVNTFFKEKRSFEISINEEDKLKVDEEIQRKLPLLFIKG